MTQAKFPQATALAIAYGKILAPELFALTPMPAGADGPATRISDVIVPQIFTTYVQQLTEQKSRLIQSGALARDGAIDQLLAGGGLTFNVPSFRDLDNDDDNVSGDEADDRFTNGSSNSSPKKIQTSMETAVRLSRNQSWSSTDLTSALAGVDPMGAIAGLVAGYWSRRLQAAFVATMNGVFAMAAAAPANGSTHTAGDMDNDISGASFSAGTTDFSAEAALDALVTIGDSQDDLGMVMVHSIVYNRMQKNNLIDFIPDARGEVNIPTFLGRTVIVDDGVPNTDGVYDSWFFGSGAVRLGVGSPKVPTETNRDPDAGNGGGQDALYSRLEWAIHPNGHRYRGTAPNGGPSNAATTNNLANLASWIRSFPERKQIKIARLITREHAAA